MDGQALEMMRLFGIMSESLVMAKLSALMEHIWDIICPIRTVIDTVSTWSQLLEIRTKLLETTRILISEQFLLSSSRNLDRRTNTRSHDI